MTTYFFIAASEKFLTVEEPLEEILKERERNYRENNKEKDFWILKNPSFLQTSLLLWGNLNVLMQKLLIHLKLSNITNH